MYVPSITIRKVPKRQMLSISRYEIDTEIVIMTMEQYKELLNPKKENIVKDTT